MDKLNISVKRSEFEALKEEVKVGKKVDKLVIIAGLFLATAVIINIIQTAT